jgi:hypothetical protein
MPYDFLMYLQLSFIPGDHFLQPQTENPPCCCDILFPHDLQLYVCLMLLDIT